MVQACGTCESGQVDQDKVRPWVYGEVSSSQVQFFSFASFCFNLSNSFGLLSLHFV